MDAVTRERGTITKWVNGSWGFITPALDGEDGDWFFHRSSITSRGLDGGRSIPSIGAACTFIRGTSAQNGRPAAVSVQIETES